jgi:hypothetical protein
MKISTTLKERLKHKIPKKIVLRPGPVQDLSSGFWPGQFFNQNDVILVKKKYKSTGLQLGLDRVLPGQPAGSAWSHQVFPSFIFSLTWSGSSPGSAESRIDPPSRAGFQNYTYKGTIQ